VPAVLASALAQLESEIGVVLDQRRDEIVRQLARILVGVVVEERQGRRSRNGRPGGPKLCSVCEVRVAAPARTICSSCKGRLGRQRQQLRQAQASDRNEKGSAHRASRWIDVDELRQRSPCPGEVSTILRNEIRAGRIESDGNGRVRLLDGALPPDLVAALGNID
jgi:hypothetical protein